ncbi:hypothetical protein JMN32_03050 [Fulvivirga sp. 29W222]|uniref:Uncharacterized protein n=1 Tax=Fulvivirga marina TaxID=2494733 RepID=A0A937FTD8_9BACT|nr:hypothetical protein [Fulvivirga marina]MBL6445269.1 hypothetical protein [Fulvivirga marina]
MKAKLFTILAIIFSATFFSSCTEEEITPEATKNSNSSIGHGENDTNF